MLSVIQSPFAFGHVVESDQSREGLLLPKVDGPVCKCHFGSCAHLRCMHCDILTQ